SRGEAGPLRFGASAAGGRQGSAAGGTRAAVGASDRAELCGGQAPAEAGGGRAQQLLLRPAELFHGSGKRQGWLADVAGVDSGSALRIEVRRRAGRVAADAGVPGQAGRAVAVTRLGDRGPVAAAPRSPLRAISRNRSSHHGRRTGSDCRSVAWEN